MGNEATREDIEELNRRIIEAVPAGLVHVAVDGTILRANEQALRILGLAFDEITQRYTTDFAPVTMFEDGSACTVEQYPVTRALLTGETQPPVTIGVGRPDGELSWAIFTAVPVKGPCGAVTGAVVTFLDISERKRIEAERKALEGRLLMTERLASIGTLAAGVAHEVNNPLTWMMSSLAEASEDYGHLDAHLRRLLNDAREGAERIARVVRDLGTFARKDERGGDAVDPVEVVESALRLADRSLRGRAEVVRQFSPTGKVPAGPRLGQVLLNLLINAIHAMDPEEGSEHRLTLSISSPEPDRVRISVKDTGVGIPAELLGRIFDPFVTTKAQGVGSGLGLYISQSLVHDMGGALSVQSAPGAGSTFTVELPAVRS